MFNYKTKRSNLTKLLSNQKYKSVLTLLQKNKNINNINDIEYARNKDLDFLMIPIGHQRLIFELLKENKHSIKPVKKNLIFNRNNEKGFKNFISKIDLINSNNKLLKENNIKTLKQLKKMDRNHFRKIGFGVLETNKFLFHLKKMKKKEFKFIILGKKTFLHRFSDLFRVRNLTFLKIFSLKNMTYFILFNIFLFIISLVYEKRKFEKEKSNFLFKKNVDMNEIDISITPETLYFLEKYLTKNSINNKLNLKFAINTITNFLSLNDKEKNQFAKQENSKNFFSFLIKNDLINIKNNNKNNKLINKINKNIKNLLSKCDLEQKNKKQTIYLNEILIALISITHFDSTDQKINYISINNNKMNENELKKTLDLFIRYNLIDLKKIVKYFHLYLVPVDFFIKNNLVVGINDEKDLLKKYNFNVDNPSLKECFY